MTDIDRAFRDAEQMPVQDLWPDIVTRTPGEPPSRSPGPRATAVVVAVAVAILGIGFLLRAFSEGSTQQATRVTNTPVSHVPRVYEADGKIVVAEGDGSGLPLTRGYSPTLSPDGTTIAFLRDPRDQHAEKGSEPFVLQAWLINVDGSDLRKVGQQRGCCVAIRGSVAWSKDGSSIVLRGTHEQTIHVATADLSRVYESMGSGYSPKLSPDGTTIAFLRDPSYNPPNWNGPPFVLQVWLINADGSGLRKLAQLPGCCIVIRGDLRWSKDGSSIVLMADGQRRFDVASGRRLPMRSSKG